MTPLTVAIIGLGWLFSKSVETKVHYELITNKDEAEDRDVEEDDLLSDFDEDALHMTSAGWTKIWEGMYERKW